jgi:hypothetical protein
VYEVWYIEEEVWYIRPEEVWYMANIVMYHATQSSYAPRNAECLDTALRCLIAIINWLPT